MSGRAGRKPRVSVVMAACDEPRGVLCRAIESIRNQTMTDLELVVCGDNPARSAMHRAVRQRYADDARLRFLFNDRNIGLGHSLNRCLGAARGEIIARMDADDVSLPNRIERQLAVLEEGRGRRAVFTAAAMVDAQGRRFPRARPGDASFRAHFFRHDPFLHATLMMRAADFRRFGYRISEPPEDYDLYFRLHRAGYRFVLLDDVLYHYHFADKARYRSADALRRRARKAARTQLALMSRHAAALAGCHGFARAYLRCLSVMAASATPSGYRLGKAVYARLRPAMGR